jgi:hypothetical protein
MISGFPDRFQIANVWFSCFGMISGTKLRQMYGFLVFFRGFQDRKTCFDHQCMIFLRFWDDFRISGSVPDHRRFPALAGGAPADDPPRTVDDPALIQKS